MPYNTKLVIYTGQDLSVNFDFKSASKILNPILYLIELIEIWTIRKRVRSKEYDASTFYFNFPLN